VCGVDEGVVDGGGVVDSGWWMVGRIRYRLLRLGVLLNEWMNLPPCPQFWGNKRFQSHPILGDVGGLEECNIHHSYFGSATLALA
jgi:hypothetical protein